MASNPLAQARGKRNDPAIVWHKRTGAGYRLFVEYYASQPTGVVVQDTTPVESTKQPLTAQQGKGLSRAAKRRKRKRGVAEVSSELPPEEQAAQVSHPLLHTDVPNSSHLIPLLECLARPLPMTLRFRLSSDTKADRKELPDLFRCLPFGRRKIYQAAFPKAQLPAPWKEWVQERSQSGILARQEIGSMLPVLLLEYNHLLRPGQSVLDTCASPGSKTMQAAEVAGMVTANDVLESRLDALKEAVERSGAPLSVQYTCHDATRYPSSRSWDVVLCDVPCSGDGTTRKDKHVLPLWSPHQGHSLHGTQLGILKRALKNVKVGGVVCYSTCSLNPVEDEAVVAAALCDGIQLVKFDVPDGLILRDGVNTWKVADYLGPDDDEVARLTWYDSYEQAKQAGMKDVVPSLWPSRSDAPLERCKRLVPHDQDTGGFFVAILKRTH